MFLKQKSLREKVGTGESSTHRRNKTYHTFMAKKDPLSINIDIVPKKDENLVFQNNLISMLKE